MKGFFSRARRSFPEEEDKCPGIETGRKGYLLFDSRDLHVVEPVTVDVVGPSDFLEKFKLIRPRMAQVAVWNTYTDRVKFCEDCHYYKFKEQSQTYLIIPCKSHLILY